MPHTPVHAIGDKVRVTDGPFVNHDAIIRAVADGQLQLDVTARHLTVPITVEPGQIESLA